MQASTAIGSCRPIRVDHERLLADYTVRFRLCSESDLCLLHPAHGSRMPKPIMSRQFVDLLKNAEYDMAN